MDLSIIIINFRTFELTRNCILSIVANIRDLQYEIILVDNAPKQDLKKEFERLHPGLVYLRSEENIGFGRANNMGMSRAKGKYMLLINSDTLVTDNAIEKCFAFMESHNAKDIGLLGCKLLNEDRTYQPSFFPFTKNSLINYIVANNQILYKFCNIARKYRQPDKVIEVGDVSGAFMFLRREVFDELGGFDPDFFLYCEETEWCRERIAKHYKIVYFPDAAIVHFGGQSAPKEAMYIQAKLSLSLLWYKKGWRRYLSYIICSYFNVAMNLLALPFVGIDGKRSATSDLHCFIRLLPYLFTDVPRSGRQFGSRKEPLVYGKAKAIFFGT